MATVSLASQVIDNKEWELATKVRTNLDLFNLISRNFVSKDVIPVKKLAQVEFLVKP